MVKEQMVKEQIQEKKPQKKAQEKKEIVSAGAKSRSTDWPRGKGSLTIAAKKTPVKDSFDPYKIIRFPLSTEKAVRQIEFDNKLVFAVHPQATKRDVKKAVEELFKVTVVKVNIDNSFTGIKKAYVRLGGGSLASDVSADLGLI